MLPSYRGSNLSIKWHTQTVFNIVFSHRFFELDAGISHNTYNIHTYILIQTSSWYRVSMGHCPQLTNKFVRACFFVLACIFFRQISGVVQQRILGRPSQGSATTPDIWWLDKKQTKNQARTKLVAQWPTHTSYYYMCCCAEFLHHQRLTRKNRVKKCT